MKASDWFYDVSDYVLFRCWVRKFYNCNVDNLPDDVIREALADFESNYIFFKKFFVKE